MSKRFAPEDPDEPEPPGSLFAEPSPSSFVEPGYVAPRRAKLKDFYCPTPEEVAAAHAESDRLIAERGGTIGMARRTDPDTSHAAAEDASVNAWKHRRRVLDEHRRCPDGLTDFELAERLGLQQTSAGKRRGELRDAGLVYDSGIKRPAPSGSLAIVWKISDSQPTLLDREPMEP